jgi:hypothetical protein
LLALVLALLMAPAAERQQLFSDFPVNGQIGAFQVNGGYSNSFTLASGGAVGEAVFGAWVNSGVSVTGVTWLIGTTPFDTSLGKGVAGVTSPYDSTNVDGFDALKPPWSIGPVEGHIRRLKLIKRSMYGRAKFDLLILRVLHAA